MSGSPELRRVIGPDKAPPAILYIPPSEPERREVWDSIARFVWAARWKFEGPGGWSPDMVEPRCKPIPEGSVPSHGLCSVSSTAVALEMQKRYGVQLSIGAGSVLVPAKGPFQYIEDHVVSQEPKGSGYRYHDPDAMFIDPAADQLLPGLAVIVASRRDMFHLAGVNYHAKNGEFTVDDFVHKGRRVQLASRAALLRTCLDGVRTDPVDESLFLSACQKGYTRALGAASICGAPDVLERTRAPWEGDSRLATV